ncbi:MAG: class I SAM-dependent methyltransferase [Nocardioides sp.]|nr:class I SAM-dependent methyltransferase [Nocardioides sp.]
MEGYTHGHHESVLRSHRWRTAENSAAYLLPHLSAEQRLLDVGAGPATISVDLARLVAHVTVTEIGESELDLGRRTATEEGIANIDFRVEDVHALTIDDAAYDVVHAHQVLQHVSDPVQALREMRRVTRPGGLVAVRDSDYAGFVWWPEVPALVEWLDLYHQAARANGGEPDAGRRLRSWALQAGFTEVTSSSSTWCYATPEERAWWGGLWADRFTDSAVARQIVDTGLGTSAGLARIAAGWRTWANAEDGWFSAVHGEALARA